MKQVGTVTIASGGTNSTQIDAIGTFEYLLVMFGDFTGATWTVQVSPDRGTTWFTMEKPEDGGTMTPPEASASVIRIGGAETLRIVSVSAEAAERTIYYVLS